MSQGVPGEVDSASHRERVRQEADLWYEQVANSRREAERLKQELESLRQTKTFRYSAVMRAGYGVFLRRLRRRTAADDASRRSYSRWIDEFDTLTDTDRSHLRHHVMSLRTAPTFSVVMPVYNTPELFLREAVESVLNQIYPRFELCIADDCSTDQRTREVVDRYESLDPRVKVTHLAKRGHISVATNTAIKLATGDWVAFLDHDDCLAEHALAVLAIEIANAPHLRMIYSDEDHLDTAGHRVDPMFKSDFDPARLLASNYVCHLLAVRRQELCRVGGMRYGFEGSQDYDLVLRLSEVLEDKNIRHVPRILYHWRAHRGSTGRSHSAKGYAADASKRAVEEHLARTNRQGRVMNVHNGPYQRVRWTLPTPRPLVSIVIPTRDGAHLTNCMESLYQTTSYRPYEVVVVDNGSVLPNTLDYLDRLRHDSTRATLVLRDDAPFNYPRLNNLAMAHSQGEVICLLNDDTRIVSAEWLEELVAELMQPGVGAVGCKLYYPDGRMQHAGMVLGMGGGAGHLFRHSEGASLGYMGLAAVARSVSAVTGACMAIRRSVWVEANGFDEQAFPVSFNDVDFCLRIRERGWRIIWTPNAEVVHFESASRGSDDELGNMRRWIGELAEFRRRWGDRLDGDPYYNPNLALDASDCRLAWPPRMRNLRDCIGDVWTDEESTGGEEL